MKKEIGMKRTFQFWELARKELWEDYVLSNNIYSPVFQWLELYYAPKHNINYPFKNNSINPIFNKKYKYIISDQEINSQYVPKKGVIIYEGFIETPLYKVQNQQTFDKGFQNIIYQNNYSNEVLYTIREHLDKIELKISKEIYLYKIL